MASSKPAETARFKCDRCHAFIRADHLEDIDNGLVCFDCLAALMEPEGEKEP